MKGLSKIFYILILLLFVLLGILTILAFMFFGSFFGTSREKTDWWRTMSLYQIYPRSFKDSDGDGIGDLKGIQSKLKHLVESKITAFWLSPVYKSPMVDFGYDISDFKAIDPIFGTMDDFDDLLREAHRLNLKLIMDFVPNHSSDQHEWFQKSLKKIDPYTDFYVWHEGKIINGTRHPPNNWISVLYGPSWTWREERQAWYFHNFLPEQPDLNFRNKYVVEEIKNVLRFWLNKGVDGFRVDAIGDLFEVKDFRDEPLTGLTNDPLNYSYTFHDSTNHLWENYDMVRQWRKVLDEYDKRIIAMEIYGNISTVMAYYTYGATFPFNYEFIDTLRNHSTAKDFKKVIDDWIDNIPEGDVLNWGAGNHDRSRLLTRLGREFGQAVQILVHLLPGIAITYYGEEIGMENTFYTWEETVDPEGCMVGPERYARESRDKVRQPFPWDNSTSAGFSKNPKPWLPVDKNYHTLNLAAQKQASNSYWKSFVRVTSLREWPAVRSGTLRTEVLHENILAISRELKNEKSVYVIVNFSNGPQIVNLHDFKNIPAELQFYHATSDVGFRIKQIVQSDTLHVPARGASIFVSVDSSSSCS